MLKRLGLSFVDAFFVTLTLLFATPIGVWAFFYGYRKGLQS
jgi:hypothetical protein